MKRKLAWLGLVLGVLIAAQAIGNLRLPINWALNIANDELNSHGRYNTAEAQSGYSARNGPWGNYVKVGYDYARTGETSVARINVTIWRPLSFLDWQFIDYEEVPMT